jgi:drug/metabolite transporter (DMT)-like permease
MKRLNQTTSFFLIGFSVLILISSLKVGIGNLQAPGAGLMGFLASVLLFVLSSVNFVGESLKSVLEKKEGRFSWESLSKQFIITVALCGYAFFLDTLGFLLSSFVLMWIMFLIDNPRKWFHHMVVAFLVTNVSYLILYKLLRVLLPAGIFRIQW